ncbi:bestrophin-like domain [Polynucleobacter necessarius]
MYCPARTKDLLSQYLDQRILFYSRQSKEKIQDIRHQTDELQAALWKEILPIARAQSTATTALVVSGMNDVLNSQGYVQAAWWNRIPYPAWALMAAIAVCANILVGFGARNFRKNIGLFMIFPFVVAVSFFLIADIDSPRGGIIRIEPKNLITLKQALNPQIGTQPATSK